MIAALYVCLGFHIVEVILYNGLYTSDCHEPKVSHPNLSMKLTAIYHQCPSCSWLSILTLFFKVFSLGSMHYFIKTLLQSLEQHSEGLATDRWKGRQTDP